MKGETVTRLSLALYYRKSYYDTTSPACQDMFLCMSSFSKCSRQPFCLEHHRTWTV